MRDTEADIAESVHGSLLIVLGIFIAAALVATGSSALGLVGFGLGWLIGSFLAGLYRLWRLHRGR